MFGATNRIVLFGWIVLGLMCGASAPSYAEDATPVSARGLHVYDALLSPEHRNQRPKTLSRERLQEGFAHIRRSTEQCIDRQLKRGGEFPVESVRVEVLIRNSGRVSKLKLPRQLKRTIFGRCLQAHSSRWLFEPFTGHPIRAGKRFRLFKPKTEPHVL